MTTTNPSYSKSSGLDSDSRRFQAEVDALVREWAAGDDYMYWRRWKQLGSWSINRTQGDVIKKDALKRKLMQTTGGRCQDCRRELPRASLQMHRLDTTYAHDASRNFGYIEENVVLVCGGCHEEREVERR
jgi:hypothetical protein